MSVDIPSAALPPESEKLTDEKRRIAANSRWRRWFVFVDASVRRVAQNTPVGADPTATAKDTAVNGTADTFMRSDAAPAVQKASDTVFGLVKVDGTSITESGGVISATAPSVPTGANPSATAGPAAVNGSASTFMRSDGAPAVQLGTNAQKGIVQVDGSTITAASGVISAVKGLVPSYTVLTVPTATAGLIALITDESGGAVLAFADGAAWRRVTDRNVIS